ncbi:MAG: tyrosine-type recombinase/integrase [Deltaproteobacteria bacterium]|nr:tyrosine-type recombinase/integrase [Deltaproteobacteria bacterium]MCL5792954.1 tyrosine-type recombinase/integrase [Deltaproteobacteria bacterium]
MNNLPVVQKLSMARYESKDIPVYLSAPEVNAMLEACKNNKRDHLLINVLWQSGCRITEGLKITRNDVDLYNLSIKVLTEKKRSKKGKPIYRVIPITAELSNELASYALTQNITERFFDITRQRAFQIIRSIAHKAGITKPVHPHTLRHSFAVNCIGQGVPLPVVKDLLGHSSVLTTMVYLRIVQLDTRQFLSGIKF